VRQLTRCLSTPPALDKFTSAQTKLKTLNPSNDDKLRLYGLFKQANSGQCNIARPSTFNMVARAKYESWNRLGSMSQAEAREQYVSIIEELGEGSVEEEGSGLEITAHKGVKTLRLNRPHKNNALTWDMFRIIGDTLSEAAEDEGCRVMVLTGTGEWYSSGNDLDNFTKLTPDGRISGSKEGSVLQNTGTAGQEIAGEAGSSEVEQLLNRFMTAFITFPKPLIAAVNGPAIGIPVSSLGYCDLVYCVERATFMTPFVSLGQSPEACSSYTFPRIMGFAKASEMLLTEREFSSQEAMRAGLVTRVLQEEGFIEQVTEVAEHIASLPPQSMGISKQLIRGGEYQDKLLNVNQRELAVLRERVLSEECRTAVMNFLMKNKD